MTDREKLAEIITSIDPKVFFWSIIRDKEFGMSLNTNKPWQPSGRPCFDKPASVPILHRETV